MNIGNEPYAQDFTVAGQEVEGGNGAYQRFGVKFSECIDGLSNTSAFSERLTGRGRHRPGEDIWISGMIDTGGPWPNAEQLLKIEIGDCPPGGNFEYAGHDWRAAGLTHTWYNHIRTPNQPKCDFILQSVLLQNSPPLGGLVSPSSNHSSGVNNAMMDGSVGFISDSIEPAIWRAIGSRNGEEPSHQLN